MPHPATIVHDGIRALIRYAGDDPDRPGLAETPDRWLRAMMELVGPDEDAPTAADLLGKVFPDVAPTGEPITVGPIPFRTVCEHHLLPFTGTAWIAYTPSTGRTVGLSKLPRLVALHARALNVQESMTRGIAEDIEHYLKPEGFSIAVVAEHTCTTLRGARATGTLMRTYAFSGTHDTAAERVRVEALTRAP
jgi:GTP cyclohydrolase IA